MPLFGGNKDEENAQLHAELQRISALPLPQLAAEVMRKGWSGPDSPGAADGTVKVRDLVGEFNPADGLFAIDEVVAREIHNVVSEGVQALEHASLVRTSVGTQGGGAYYTYAVATRAGRAALQRGDVERLAGGAA
jgi:hypothetical protein